MKELIEWVKANANTTANVAEFEEAAGKYALPDSKEKAWDFIQKNPAFKSALDAEVSRATSANETNFRERKLPGIEKELRDKLMKELNPEESPAEKRARAAEDRAEAIEKKLEQKERYEKFVDLCNDKGIAPSRAKYYSMFDDDTASRLLAEDVDYLEKEVSSRYEKAVKEKLGKNQEPGSSKPKGKVLPLAEFQMMSPKDQAAFMATGGGLE